MNGIQREGRYLSLTRLGDGVMEITLDRRDDSINMLDEHFTSELGLLLDTIRSDGSLRGVLLSSAKRAFLVGADLNVLLKLCDRPAGELAAFSLENGKVLSTLEDLPVPVVVAINGYALGGGLELALCADYRVLASDGQVGLPEVSFGIVPGWGGTVRLPRLANCQVALDWIVGARPQMPPKALEDGVVDALSHPAQLRQTALHWLHRAMRDELDWRTRRRRCKGAFEFEDSAIALARDKAQKGARFLPAALAVVDLLVRCAPLDRDAALSHEAETFARLVKTPTARALVAAYLSNQRLTKSHKNQAVEGNRVGRAAVLGAGIMGGGIAFTSALNRIPVLLKDISKKALNLGTGEARKLLLKHVEAGRMPQEQADAVLASIVPVLEFEQFDTVDLVIEAVVESLDVKREVLANVESLVKPGTVLASNTSSLSIAEIAAALKRPEDMVGLHFFNPVHQMPLVEVIRGPATRAYAIATAVGYVSAMGKTPLVVKDCPGFLVNRLLGAYMTAFLRLVHDGADFLSVDRVMQAWGWPMGPAYLMDVAGIDTLDKALIILGKAYPNVMATPYPTAIQLLASQQRCGQKSAAGFYLYEIDSKGKPRRSEDPRIGEVLGQVQPRGRVNFADEEIEERLMLAMILEAARCFDEEVTAGAAEIDVGMRLGTGFPAHHGGPLWYADSMGSAEVIRRCERYASLGGLYEVRTNIAAFMRKGGRFYGSHASLRSTPAIGST
jgi:3-hydroxyacyl-CoA dehydrogenase/enoyl-CoA hydratase/3-hydroxybutyryl-CoA epimerase/enoyl-CoA isomerase